jgi:hypothetical protein
VANTQMPKSHALKMLQRGVSCTGFELKIVSDTMSFLNNHHPTYSLTNLPLVLQLFV